MAETNKALSTPGQFDQKDFIKKVENTDDLMLLKCPNCGEVHFRHAGYVEAMTPYVSLQPEAGATVKSSTTSLPVKVCVNCKHCYIDYLGKIHDITDHIKLGVWEKAEPELQKATGPGGEC